MRVNNVDAGASGRTTFSLTQPKHQESTLAAHPKRSLNLNDYLILRKYCRHESPLTLAFIIALVFFTFGLLGMIVIDNLSLTEDIILSAPFIAIGWPKLTLIILGFCFFASFLNLLGNICMSRAYQTAESSWLAPLDFSYLLFLTIWGKILFDDLPSQSAALGMVMIALAGMITAFRESYNRKKPSFVKL